MFYYSHIIIRFRRTLYESTIGKEYKANLVRKRDWKGVQSEPCATLVWANLLKNNVELTLLKMWVNSLDWKPINSERLETKRHSQTHIRLFGIYLESKIYLGKKFILAKNV
jgi:hypothetical protein